ncbi:MAG: hypothetical protein PVH88_01135 [Ignavibacteria bacterium]|jgi:predicted GH43/DUF377 family glycosyl hydrolase
MSKRTLYLTLLYISLAFVMPWTGCTEDAEDSLTAPDGTTITLENAGSLQLSFNKTSATEATEDIDTVTAILTRSGYESVQENIAVGDGSASGTMYNVAEGTWHLTIRAKDSTGTVLYSGNTEVEIVSDQTTYVTIELSAAATSGNLSINVTWEEGDGINWTVYSGNPVLDLGASGEWDDYDVAHPSIIYNGTYYEMWFGGYDGSNHSIGYATSTDGINWSKYSGNPVLNYGDSGEWDDYIASPSVIYDGTSYEMWYSGYDGSNYRIGYASSQDGINWTKYSGNPVMNLGTSGEWDDQSVSYPSVIYNGTHYEMWYTGYDGTNCRIGYATSTDGINWSKNSGNPVLDLGTTDSWDDERLIEPNVILNGSDDYKMWYSGYDGSSTRHIGYATSTDGINWTKYSGNPVLDVGTSEINSGLFSSFVLYNGTSYKMWFGVISDGINRRIGYATSP